ncbi:variable surface protein Vir14, putative [Plasmodium vivax]|uniref:Variable surface protein Vir14, putative n=1 Tax=Plasmodium vivax (strain Salvador I) TaxID=126793 RepID=A5KD48_PLAVS|nr:variable surface protein Vir14, putative [Plasmodium vivax]EDL42721.1 variable surface protein Vir14, putative [Plasmodium vivax]|eukprot:XP_001612514.1 variable surface protein Vir14 [Plasmodium vivax Sal-1]
MTGQDIWERISSLFFSFSNELNSQYFYNQLEDIEDFKEYFPNCETISSFQEDIKAKKICAKLLKFLESDKISINKNDEYDVCMLLSFWVYSKLYDILKTKGENYVNIAYGELQQLWTDFIDVKLKKPKNKTCRPIFELVLYNDWKKRKELYEYYVDYSALSKTLVGYKQRCKEFYKYVESKRSLYNHFKEPCLLGDTKKCPDFYAKCKQYDPDIVLPHSDCPNEIMKEHLAAASRGQPREKALSGSEPISEERDGRMLPHDAPKFSGNPKTVENVGNILLGVVATTMTSGALYRFTPLGGMIRNGLGWNNNNMSNINGGDFRLYDYASEPFNPYPGEEHYIGYHPA